MHKITIGESPNYKIFVGTGSMFPQEFQVRANSEENALAIIANHCEKRAMDWLYIYSGELAGLCGKDETVNAYAARQDLTECGENGIYMQIKGIEEI